MRKAFYGLKQAPRAWYNRIDKHFLDHGFERSDREPTLYIKRYENGEFIMICLYVDDMIFAGSSDAILLNFKELVMAEFEMTYLACLHYFLGLEITQEEDNIFLSQELYAKALLKKFGMLCCNPALIPLNPN